MKRLVSHIVALILLLNTGLASFFVSANLQNLNATSTDDVLVICTGTQVKWIDAQVYFDTGKIIELSQQDLPEDLELKHPPQACSVLFGLDKPLHVGAITELFTQHTCIKNAAVVTCRSQQSSNQAYFKPLLRGPPLA